MCVTFSVSVVCVCLPVWCVCINTIYELPYGRRILCQRGNHWNLWERTVADVNLFTLQIRHAKFVDMGRCWIIKSATWVEGEHAAQKASRDQLVFGRNFSRGDIETLSESYLCYQLNGFPFTDKNKMHCWQQSHITDNGIFYQLLSTNLHFFLY